MVRMTALLVSALVLAFALPAEAKTIRVHKGQSIQAAVDRAKPGDRVLVSPGVYREEGTPCPAVSAQTCAVAIKKHGI
jgi:nitrous oxidase accessory protein NosD